MLGLLTALKLGAVITFALHQIRATQRQ